MNTQKLMRAAAMLAGLRPAGAMDVSRTPETALDTAYGHGNRHALAARKRAYGTSASATAAQQRTAAQRPGTLRSSEKTPKHPRAKDDIPAEKDVSVSSPRTSPPQGGRLSRAPRPRDPATPTPPTRSPIAAAAAAVAPPPAAVAPPPPPPAVPTETTTREIWTQATTEATTRDISTQTPFIPDGHRGETPTATEKPVTDLLKIAVTDAHGKGSKRCHILGSILSVLFILVPLLLVADFAQAKIRSGSPQPIMAKLPGAEWLWENNYYLKLVEGVVFILVLVVFNCFLDDRIGANHQVKFSFESQSEQFHAFGKVKKVGFWNGEANIQFCKVVKVDNPVPIDIDVPITLSVGLLARVDESDFEFLEEGEGCVSMGRCLGKSIFNCNCSSGCFQDRKNACSSLKCFRTDIKSVGEDGNINPKAENVWYCSVRGKPFVIQRAFRCVFGSYLGKLYFEKFLEDKASGNTLCGRKTFWIFWFPLTVIALALMTAAIVGCTGWGKRADGGHVSESCSSKLEWGSKGALVVVGLVGLNIFFGMRMGKLYDDYLMVHVDSEEQRPFKFGSPILLVIGKLFVLARMATPAIVGMITSPQEALDVTRNCAIFVTTEVFLILIGLPIGCLVKRCGLDWNPNTAQGTADHFWFVLVLDTFKTIGNGLIAYWIRVAIDKYNAEIRAEREQEFQQLEAAAAGVTEDVVQQLVGNKLEAAAAGVTEDVVQQLVAIAAGKTATVVQKPTKNPAAAAATGSATHSKSKWVSPLVGLANRLRNRKDWACASAVMALHLSLDVLQLLSNIFLEWMMSPSENETDGEAPKRKVVEEDYKGGHCKFTPNQIILRKAIESELWYIKGIVVPFFDKLAQKQGLGDGQADNLRGAVQKLGVWGMTLESWIKNSDSSTS